MMLHYRKSDNKKKKKKKNPITSPADKKMSFWLRYFYTHQSKWYRYGSIPKFVCGRLSPCDTLFGNRAWEEEIKVKWGPMGRLLI